MNKTLIASYPIFANLHGGLSEINTGSFYWKVFGSEGFVLGDLFSVGLYNNRIEMVLLGMKKWNGWIITGEKFDLFKKYANCIHIYKLAVSIGRPLTII